jgi:membrane-associated protease RseP (regulator of RpoE activity)
MASEDTGLEIPEVAPEPLEPAFPPFYAPPRRRFQNRWWRHILLFVVTVASTTLLGIEHYLAFKAEFGANPVAYDWHVVLPQGLLYSAAILGILGAHEMGHYLACRYYEVDATLPFFIPFISWSGTLGAVIRIREPFPTRTVLFDVGVAGPIAGFVVLVPILFIGMHMSNVVHLAPDIPGLVTLGEPLLFKVCAWFTFGSIPDGYGVNIHPIVFAAWFGMLATYWNLLPFGQLDGGHLTYATLGTRARYFSLATVAFAIAMTTMWLSWAFMTVMMVLMLVLLGPGHPRVIYEHEPLAKGRVGVALCALVMFIVCFMPAPIYTSWRDLLK